MSANFGIGTDKSVDQLRVYN